MVVIGGIGDSGTRGVAATVEALVGKPLCVAERLKRDGSLDCVAWKRTDLSNIVRVLRRAEAHASASPSFLHGIVHTVHAECSWFCSAMDKALTTADGSSGRGWKDPESWVWLPLLRASLGAALRYIHVVRDVRDVVLNANQCQFLKFCDALYAQTLNQSCGECMAISHAPTCREPAYVHEGLSCAHSVSPWEGTQHEQRERLRLRAAFWSLLNSQIHAFGTSRLGGTSYMLLHIEDLVRDEPQGTLERLARFIEAPTPSAALLKKVADRNAANAAAYNRTNRYNASQLEVLPSLGPSLWDPDGYYSMH